MEKNLRNYTPKVSVLDEIDFSPFISLAGQLPGYRLVRSSFFYTIESVLQILL